MSLNGVVPFSQTLLLRDQQYAGKHFLFQQALL